MRTRADDRLLRDYGALPLFEGCSRAQLREVERAATRLDLRSGTVLLRQGERPRQFVMVLDGTAGVWRNGQPVDEIGSGASCGEIALIRRIPEPATVVADTGLVVDVIAPREFWTIYAANDRLRRRLDDILDDRIASWVRASDPRALHAAPGRPVLPSPPEPEPASRALDRSNDPRPMAVARRRRTCRCIAAPRHLRP